MKPLASVLMICVIGLNNAVCAAEKINWLTINISSRAHNGMKLP